MGKGRRNHNKTEERQEEIRLLRQRADNDAARANGFAVTAFVLTALACLFQWIIFGVLRANLSRGIYEAIHTDAAEIASLRAILPVGAIGLVLLLLGTALTAWLVRRRRPRLSLIGCGVCAAGAGFFIPYVITLGNLFRFDPLAGISGRGLDFWALLWQHYVTLVPLALLIPAVWLTFSSVRKSETVDVMEQAQQSVSTIHLDDE